jgi:hypothetical protein
MVKQFITKAREDFPDFNNRLSEITAYAEYIIDAIGDLLLEPATTENFSKAIDAILTTNVERKRKEFLKEVIPNTPTADFINHQLNDLRDKALLENKNTYRSIGFQFPSEPEGISHYMAAQISRTSNAHFTVSIRTKVINLQPKTLWDAISVFPMIFNNPE